MKFLKALAAFFTCKRRAPEKYSAYVFACNHIDEQGYYALSPDVAGACGQGDTVKETLADLKDSVDGLLESYGDNVPSCKKEFAADLDDHLYESILVARYSVCVKTGEANEWSSAS